MSDVNDPANEAGDATAGDEQVLTASEDQKAAEMEKVQKEAAIEREEEGGYQ